MCTTPSGPEPSKNVTGALPGEVEEVVEAEQVARAQVGVDRAGDVDGHDVAHPEVGERPDVGAVVDQVRWHRVAGAVPGEEDDRHPVPGAAGDPGVAERGGDGLVGGVLQRPEVVEAGAGDDAEGRAGHAHARYRSGVRSWTAPAAPS